jgi:hypothetical protein
MSNATLDQVLQAYPETPVVAADYAARRRRHAVTRGRGHDHHDHRVMIIMIGRQLFWPRPTDRQSLPRDMSEFGFRNAYSASTGDSDGRVLAGAGRFGPGPGYPSRPTIMLGVRESTYAKLKT